MDTNQSLDVPAGSSGTPNNGGNDFSFPCGTSVSEDDDEATESKIREFLDEKVLFFFCFCKFPCMCAFLSIF